MRSEPQYEAIRHLVDEVVLVQDASGRIVSVSPAVSNVLGYSEEEFRGRMPASFVHPDELHQVTNTVMTAHRKEGASYRLVMRVLHADGHYAWCDVVGRNLLHTEVKGVVSTLRDISDRRAVEEQLRHQAMHDELTRLPNRRYFLERVECVVARSKGLGVGVLALDVDGLKPVNDRLGHLAGDDLLRRCAAQMRSAVRDSDLVARIGGDEFGVLCQRVGGRRALYWAAERIREAVRGIYQVGGGAGSVTVSVGARLGRAGDTPLTLLHDADEALYAAKRAGRDRVVLAGA